MFHSFRDTHHHEGTKEEEKEERREVRAEGGGGCHGLVPREGYLEQSSLQNLANAGDSGGTNTAIPITPGTALKPPQHET